MKDILVVADIVGNGQSEEQFAFHKAQELALLSNASIHVVVFCYESLSVASADNAQIDNINLQSLIMDDRSLWWTKFLQDNPSKVSVTYEVVWEKYLHSWLVEHCKTRLYDLIVKTGHRSESVFYTPTDWQLFRSAPVPVYSVNALKYKSKKVVLVALDLMAASEEKQLLNKHLLEAAFQLSVQTASELHCCFAIKIPTLIKDMDLIDVPAHCHQIEKEARIKNQAWLDNYDIKNSYIHVEQGTPWRVITSLASRIKAHCVVIGSLGRTGVAGKLIGNTAEKVIHHAKSDLLVINPTTAKE